MATSTSIVNIALHRVGEARISSLESDTSKAGTIARDIYDEARKDLLRGHWWNFAMRFEALAQYSTTPTGWDYAFQLPSDFLRLRSVHSTSDPQSPGIPYALEHIQHNNAPKQAILSNYTTIYMRYVCDVSDANLMSPDFRDLLSARIALEMATALKRPRSMVEALESFYTRKMGATRSVDGQENYPDRFDEGSWSRARRISTGGWGGSWT